MISNEKIQEIVEGLSIIGQDTSVPKNVRIRVQKALSLLEGTFGRDLDLKIDQSLQELGDIAEDPNLPQYTRMQIWSMVSILESR